MTRSKNPTTQRGLRRLATFTAAIGMLVMSSGVALMVTTSPGNAAVKPPKVGVCHGTAADKYVFIRVDNDSVAESAHLAHRNNPPQNLLPDIVGDYIDDEGNVVELDGVVTKATCQEGGIVDPPLAATASVNFVDPTCANENQASYSTEGDNVTFELTDGEATPGSSIEVTATANEGAEFADESDEQVFEHTFSAAATNCTIVDPPLDPPLDPPANDPIVDPPAAAPSIVSSGLTDVVSSDLRGEKGLALLVAGMIMMVLAGGLGFRPAVRTRS